MVEADQVVLEAATQPSKAPPHIEGALFMTACTISMCRGLPFPMTGHISPGWTSSKHPMHCCQHRLSRVRWFCIQARGDTPCSDWTQVILLGLSRQLDQKEAHRASWVGPLSRIVNTAPNVNVTYVDNSCNPIYFQSTSNLFSICFRPSSNVFSTYSQSICLMHLTSMLTCFPLL
jgi:hypothetical protein